MDSANVIDSKPTVMSRDEARAARLKLYYTNEPCHKGHLAYRYVSNHKCVACSTVPKPEPIPGVMTREEARAAGLKSYLSLNSCKRGHLSLRYVLNNLCIECHNMRTEKSKKRRAKCSIDGCDQISDTRGYCKSHYQKWKKHGDPLASFCVPKGTALKWIHEHVNYQSEGCLIWPFGTRRPRGEMSAYGAVYVDGKTISAHVYMCSLVNGPKPTPKHVSAHSCGRGHDGCVHPGHLRWSTYAENAADMVEHGTRLMGTKHPMAKLNEDQVREIRALKGKVKTRDLAKRFGVSPGPIGEIQRGKTWRHVK